LHACTDRIHRYASDQVWLVPLCENPEVRVTLFHPTQSSGTLCMPDEPTIPVPNMATGATDGRSANKAGVACFNVPSSANRVLFPFIHFPRAQSRFITLDIIAIIITIVSSISLLHIAQSDLRDRTARRQASVGVTLLAENDCGKYVSGGPQQQHCSLALARRGLTPCPTFRIVSPSQTSRFEVSRGRKLCTASTGSNGSNGPQRGPQSQSRRRDPCRPLQSPHELHLPIPASFDFLSLAV
jgi:hypothetical protein